MVYYPSPNQIFTNDGGMAGEQHKIQLSNLSYSMTLADLDALAKQYASPEHIELQYALDGRPAGRAIILTRCKQSADILYNAFNGMTWDGRTVRAKSSKGKYFTTTSYTTTNIPVMMASQYTATPPPLLPVLPSAYHNRAEMDFLVEQEFLTSAKAGLYELVCFQAAEHYAALAQHLEHLVYTFQCSEAQAINHGRYQILPQIRCDIEVVQQQYREALYQSTMAKQSNIYHTQLKQSASFMEQKLRETSTTLFPPSHDRSTTLGLNPAAKEFNIPPGDTAPYPAVYHFDRILRRRPIIVHSDRQQQISTIAPQAAYMTLPGQLPVNLSAGALQTESRGIFIGNLSFGANWYELKKYLQSAGKVLHLRIPRDNQDKGRGFATVLFSDTKTAKKAVEMFHGQNFDGRVLRVRLDTEKQPNTKMKQSVAKKDIPVPMPATPVSMQMGVVESDFNLGEGGKVGR